MEAGRVSGRYLKVGEQEGRGIAWGESVLNRWDTKRCRGGSWCGSKDDGEQDWNGVINKDGRKGTIGADLVCVGDNGETGGGTRSRVGGEKREKEGNGRIYNV